MKTIKYIIPFLAIAAVSCEQPKAQGLAELRAERDSLSTLNSTIQARLLELDEEIALKDSSLSYTTVSTHNVTTGPFNHYFQVYGSVEADRNVTLYAESAGMIERVNVREGQTVKQGQRLLEIDDEIILNNISEVQTSLELAEELYKKQERLWNQNIGSEVQYLEAKNNYESLNSRLATLESQLRMANLTAPFAGVVDEVFLKAGEYAAPGTPIVRLVNMSQVYVTADVPESYVNRVETGSEVTLYFRSINDTITANIIQVGQFINPDNRTFKIKVGIDGGAGKYKPNMMAGVRIRDYGVDTAVVLPNHLIQQDQNGRSFVYVINRSENDLGKVERRIIGTGLSYEGETEVRSGLSGGELIVDRGARSIQDGERIRIVE